MNIIKADTLGYCMGVRRAVESAEVALKEYKDKTVYSLGPLIHNQIALDELEKKGLCILTENQIETLDSNSVVIIRAHGISPIIKNKLLQKKIVIIDATCPRVTVSQNRSAEFSEKGYAIILAGDKGHAEVEGIKGYSGSEFYCIQNLNEAKKIFSKRFDKKTLLLCQTTFSLSEFEKIAEYLKSINENLEVINTICPATKKRQDALERLCKTVDGIIVVGGKKSANTIRLFQKATTLLKEKNSTNSQVSAILIESSKEIPPYFKNFRSVGITAGASTPDSVISNVIEALQS